MVGCSCDKKIQIAYDNRISALAEISDSMKNYKKMIIAFMAFFFLISLALIASYLYLTDNAVTDNAIINNAIKNCIAVLIFLYAVVVLLLYFVMIWRKNIEVIYFTSVAFIEEELSTDNTNTARLEECEELEEVVKKAQKTLSLISDELNFCIAMALVLTVIIPILFLL